MNILITGGYGFIGGYVAERFYKEGHNIYIIDNLSQSTYTSLHFKHKFYNMDVTNPQCLEVFNAVTFDRVIHLAESLQDHTVNLIRPIIELAIQYQVPKLIYLSSVDVYGTLSDQVTFSEEDQVNPKCLKAINEVAAETYLDLHRHNQHMQISCLRVSTAYDSKYRTLQDHLKNIAKGELKDYIHVGDVVDAIYKASEFCKSEVLNICSNTLCNESYLRSLVRSSTKVVEQEKAIYSEDIGCSNKKAIYELNWVLKHHLHKALVNEERDKAYLKEEAMTSARNQTNDKPKKLKAYLPYLENIASFVGIVALTLLFKQYRIEPIIDLALVYIIVISIIYGLNQSCIAIGLSCLLYIGTEIIERQNLISIVYDSNTLLSIGLYIFVGGILGYTIDSKKNELKEKDRKYDELKEKFNFVYGLYHEIIVEKKSLEYQISTNEDSFGKIYKVISVLDTLSPDKVFDEVVHVLEKLLKVNSIAIYACSYRSNYLRLMSSSQIMKLTLAKSINIKDFPEIERALEQGSVYVNKEMNPNMPSMLAPIMINGYPIAVICLYQLEFEKLTLYMQNLFSIICNLITASLVKAQQYEQAILDEKYIQDTSILQASYFKELLDSKQSCLENGISHYILLEVTGEVDLNTYEFIKSSIRDVDYLGINKEGELFVLLSNTDKEGAEFVINRLQKRQISTQISSYEQFCTPKESVIGGIAN